MFGGNFAPDGWAFCNGQVMPIDQNTTLFQLIGTTYGGDGQTTFALPNLQSRTIVHQGTGASGTSYVLGQTGGVETVALTTNQLPVHTHPGQATTAGGTQTSPGSNLLAAGQGISLYTPQTPATAMAANAVGAAGGAVAHTNLQPYLAVSFIISLVGIFPSSS